MTLCILRFKGMWNKTFWEPSTEVSLSQTCAALLQLGGRVSLRQTKREPWLHLCLWPRWNHVGLALSVLNWVICVPKGQRALPPVLQTLPINFYRYRMDGISKTVVFSLVTQFHSLHCYKPKKWNKILKGDNTDKISALLTTAGKLGLGTTLPMSYEMVISIISLH